MPGALCNNVKEQNHAGIVGSSTDGRESDSEPSNIESKGNMGIEVSSTSSETGLSSGSDLTDAVADHDRTEKGDKLMECNILQTSSLDFHEAAHGNICEGNSTVQQEVPVSTKYSFEMLVHDKTDNHKYDCDVADWMVYWDSYYLRNYFYNIRTETSTWYPPKGMEHLAICDISYELNETVPELTEMDASPAINAPDFCILQNKIESFKESMNNYVLLGQANDELSEGVGLTACNSVSATSVPVTLRRNIEDLDELSESDGTCKDGSKEWLLSDKENIVRYLIFNFPLFPVEFH